MPSDSSLIFVLAKTKFSKAQPTHRSRHLQELNVDDMLKICDKIHKEVSLTLSRSCKEAIESHNAEKNDIPYKPTMAYYVVVARNKGSRIKMLTSWMRSSFVHRILSEFTHSSTRSKKFERLQAIKDITTASDSWEPLPIMFEDVQPKVRDFLKYRRSNAIILRARTFLSL
eukprot:IDg17955t1